MEGSGGRENWCGAETLVLLLEGSWIIPPWLLGKAGAATTSVSNWKMLPMMTITEEDNILDHKLH